MMRVAVIVVLMLVVLMIVVLMIVVLVVVRRRDRSTYGMQRPADAARGVQESLAFDPDQPRADQRDQRIARKLDDALGAAHLARGGVEQHRRGEGMFS